jgi:hypothetical protein
MSERGTIGPADRVFFGIVGTIPPVMAQELAGAVVIGGIAALGTAVSCAGKPAPHGSRQLSRRAHSLDSRPATTPLVAAGVTEELLYEDRACGRRVDRPGLDACLKSLRAGDSCAVQHRMSLT